MNKINEKYPCPVCGYQYLDSNPLGSGIYEYCYSCGFQFGVSDDAFDVTYKEWRKVWIARGMPWTILSADTPADWDPKMQLTNAGLWPFDQ